jgi:hypothetical protein
MGKRQSAREERVMKDKDTFKFDVETSVADPGCLSRILIFTHPGSRIPDPKTVPKERDEKKFCYHTFFCSHKFHKIEYYGMLFFKCQRK